MFIKVKVLPKSKNDELRQLKADKFEIRVRAEARRGDANTRVLEMLRAHFPQVKIIKLVKGETKPNKIFEIGGGGLF